MEYQKFTNIFRQQPRFEHDGGHDFGLHHYEAQRQAAEFEQDLREVVRQVIREELHGNS